MEREYLIRLPWPPSKTSKNGPQGDWRGKATAARSYKADCLWECMRQGVKASVADNAAVEITYHPPREGRFDWDNISARAKQGFDAVAEAVGIDDGNWWPVTLHRGQKLKHGCVMIHIRPGAGAVKLPLKGGISGGDKLASNA